MRVRHRLAGGLAATVGMLALRGRVGALPGGPSWFSRWSDIQSPFWVFRHLGGIAFAHACAGVVMSSLVVFGGAAVYYGRPVGVVLLKAFVWLQLVYVAGFEIAWIRLVPQLAKRWGRAVLTGGATAGVLLAGVLATVLLVLLLRLLDRIEW